MSLNVKWNGISYNVYEEGEIPLYIASPAYIPPQEEDNTRSSQWPKVRDSAVQKQPYCSICETKKDLQVHHIKPFYLFPKLELAITNLVVLCRRDHFIFGHLGDWKSYNTGILKDTVTWNKKFKNKPRIK